MASSTRFRAPSLVMTPVRWNLTVLMLMCSSPAISALVLPSATLPSTSSSRSASASTGWAGGVAGPLAANVVITTTADRMGDFRSDEQTGGLDAVQDGHPDVEQA